MSPDRSLRTAISRAARQALPWVLALAVATCTDDSTGPSRGGVGYFSFRPVYTGVTSSLSQFGIVADSVHIRLTRPVDELVLDTTVFFPPDSTALHLSLPVTLDVSPEVLSALIEITAGGVVLFVDTLEIEVVDGPPGSSPPATATLDYVGPGNNIATITVIPADTTIFFGDTLFYTSTAVDSASLPVTNYYVGWTTSDTSFAKVNSQGRLIAPNVRGTFEVIGYTPTGIADTAHITIAPVPGAILALSGAAQVGQVGDSLAALFVAQVNGPDNQPIEGIHVRFLAVTAGGAVRDSILVTDVNGQVSTRGLLGITAGNYTYSATVVGSAITTTWTASATAGLPAAIAVQTGDAQTDTAGRALPLPLTARVTDAFTNPVSGAWVYWTRMTGTGTLAADSSFTDAAGLASVGYTLSAVGTDSIKSSLAGTSFFVWFTATAINGAPASVTIFAGNVQADTVGRLLTDSLVVEVKSALALPVIGSPVVWTVLRGGVVAEDTTLTDSTGHAAAAYTLGTVTGVDSVRAQAGSATAIFTASVSNELPSLMTLVSGDGQTDTTEYTLTAPFVVEVTDMYGNIVGGAEVAFDLASGNGQVASDTVLSDGAGLASTFFTLGATSGVSVVRASLINTSAIVDFTVTAVAAAPASIVTIGGDSQIVVVNTVADTFEVLVRDGNNDPIIGAKVNWAFIPAAGSFTEILPAGIQQSFTDSLGVARGIYTAGTSADTVRVEAQIGTLIDSLYVFIIPDAPSAIAIVSGDGQADTAGSAIPLPFVVRVDDQFGNPVSGSQVAFTRTAGTGTLFADSVLTNVNGEVAVGYLFGNTPGVDSIRATLVANGDFVVFTATTIAGTPATISFLSGDGQTDTVGQQLADSLLVLVQDIDSRPLGGIPIVWSGKNGSPSTDTTVTDSLGQTWVHFTLGLLAAQDTIFARTVDSSVAAFVTANAVPDAPSAIAIASGDVQVDTAGRTLPIALVARVADAFDNPVSGVAVEFLVTGGAGTVVPDTAYTDVDGLAASSLTLDAAPGANTVRATLVGTSSSVDFSATGVLAATGSITAHAGSGQTDTVGHTLTDSLKVKVLDGLSAPITGASVVWTVVRGGSVSTDTSYTDIGGYSAVAYTLGTVTGEDTVHAQVAGGGAVAEFVANALAGSGAAISTMSGSGQTDTIGVTLPAPLVVYVSDAFSNPSPFQQVVFSVTSGSGVLSNDTVLTDVGGHASTQYTLGTVPATDSIRAQLSGTSAFSIFTATAVAGVATQLVTYSGNGGEDTVFATLSDSLVVELKDGSNGPVPGTWLFWETAGVALSADSTLTDANGRAAVQVTLGSVAILNIPVLVRNADTTLVTAFTIRANPGVATQLTYVSGEGQTGVAGDPLASPFVGLVQDAYGNLAQGAVTFTRTVGQGTVTPDTAYADTLGLVTATFLLSPVAEADTVVAQLVGTAQTLTFSATGTAGAASALTYSAGTGQADTVGRQLPSPFEVEVRDANGNAVANAWVHWTVVSGGGSVEADSTLTSLNGWTYTYLTVGTVAGLDSVIATTAGVSDTVAFYALAENDVPFALTLVSGDSQSTAVNGVLAVPVIVELQDQYGNPVDGISIGFAATPGSSAPANATDITQANGQASSGGWTVDSVAGINTLTASYAALSATATAFVLPPGASKTWIGASNSDWGTAGNWMPASVPTAVDTVFIPTGAPNSPVLDGNRSVASLILQPGTELETGSDTLISSGSVLATGAAVKSSSGGELRLSGFGEFSGQTDKLTLLNGAEVFQNSAVLGDLTIVGGALSLETATLTVGGTLTQGDRLIMSHAVDSLIVTGPFNVTTAAPGEGEITNGVLILLGDFAQTGSATDGFRPQAPHLTRFAGSMAQTADFSGSTGTASGLGAFGNVEFANASGVTFTSSFAVRNNATVTAGAVTGAAAEVDNSIATVSPTDWTIGTTTYRNSALLIPDTLSGGLTLDFLGQATLTKSFVVGGGLVLGSDVWIDLNGQRLRVGGAMQVHGRILEHNDADTVEVGGLLTFDGTFFSDMTAGALLLHGGLTQAGIANSFRASGTHQTFFTGTSGQSVSFASPDLDGNNAESFFNYVTFADSVDLATNTSFYGATTVNTGAIVTGSGGYAAFINGGLGTLNGDLWNGWLVDQTAFISTPSVMPDSLQKDLLLLGAQPILTKPLAVGGDLVIGDNFSALNPGGNWIRIDGDLTSIGTGTLVLVTLGDSVDIGGTADLQGALAMANGVLIFRGDLSVTSAAGSFTWSDPGIVRFAGSSAQTVHVENIALGSGNYFGRTEFANPSGVGFDAPAAFFTDATVVSGQVTGPAMTMNGTVVDTTNDGWQADTTFFITDVFALPRRLPRNVVFQAAVIPADSLTVGGSMTLSSGSTLVPSGWPIRVDGDLTMRSRVQMTNATDSVDIGGDVTWDGLSHAGYLWYGVLVLHGDLAVASPGQFEAGNTHRTLFVGSTGHQLAMPGANPAGNTFSDLTLEGTGGITLASGTDLSVAGVFTKAAGTPVTITGALGATVNTAGLDVDGLILDSLKVRFDGQTLVRFDNVTFQHSDSSAVQLDVLSTPGAPVTLTNISFQTQPAGGAYIQATDAALDGSALTIHMVNSDPLNGSPFTLLAGGNDGESVVWSSLGYATQPLGVDGGSTLASVVLAITGPLGDTLTGFTGPVTLAFDNNPSSGTLSGTTTVNAVAGVATFDDLSIDNAGADYRLVATAPGLVPAVSDDFNITVPLPAEFTTAWTGAASSDWDDPANWSTGLVPDATANVFIAQPYANAPVSNSSIVIGRLRVDPGASFEVASSVFQADSSIEINGLITGAGSFQPHGTGTISGDIQAQTIVSGTYDVQGTLKVSPELAIAGQLTVSANDSVIVLGLFGTTAGTGVLVQDAINSVVSVDGNAWFDGGSTAGLLTDGLFLVSGNLGTGSATLDPFAPSPTHNTILNGGGNQSVYFTTADTSLGSHFGHLQVSTNGHAVMESPTWVLGNLLVGGGATFEDTLGYGVAVLGVTTVDDAGYLKPSRLAMAGPLNLATLGAYGVPLTVYFGAGVPIPIQAAAYDTLLISRAAFAAESLSIGSDLRIEDGWGAPARFDVADQHVNVGNDVSISGNGALIMQDPSGLLTVPGNFSTNGADSRGLLTAGTLQIYGSFDQSADGSGESFRAGGTHTTEFPATGLGRYIEFDSPSGSPSDSNGSHFRNLVLDGPGTAMQGRVAASGGVTIDGSVTKSEGFGMGLASYGPVTIAATSDSVSLDFLEAWTGIVPQGAGLYNVESTRLYGGGGDLPILSYQELEIADATFQLTTDQFISGSLYLGRNAPEVGCCIAGGDLLASGHVLTIQGDLNVLGLAYLTMAAGDSVDVSGSTTFRGAANDGYLTGGTLVVRGLFNTVGTDAFQASAAHRTVLLAPGVDDIYPTPNTWFGTLVLLDGAPRRIRTSDPLVVLDSLIIGATSGLSDTLGFSTGQIDARGPVFAATGSTMFMDGGVTFAHNDIFISGGYRSNLTVFTGSNQPIPVLPYRNVSVQGTAYLSDSLTIEPGWAVSVDGSGTTALDLGSYTLHTTTFATTGQGHLTMNLPSAQLVVDGGATFGGGSTAGELIAGTITVKGTFAQDATNDAASFYASGTHKTVFADSSALAQVYLSTGSMIDGSSRFNDVEVLGRGVEFDAIAWIGGNTVVTQALDSVGAAQLILGGSLSDTTHKWLVGQTYVNGVDPLLPDSMLRNVIWSGPVDSLESTMSVDGAVTVRGALVINGQQFRAHGDFSTSIAGALDMTNPADQVTIDGTAQWSGGPETDLLTAGRLTLMGNFVRDTQPDMFDARGTHTTVLAGSSTQTLTNNGSNVYGGEGFNDLVTYNPNINIGNGITVIGTFRDSVTGGTLFLSSPYSINGHYILAGQVEIVDAQFDEVILGMGDQSQLDTVTFNVTSPNEVLSITGPGRPGPLDLHAINFPNWSTPGATMVVAVDDDPNAEFLNVRMFGSTPFDGSTLDRVATPIGELPTITWSHLEIPDGLPLTVDSLVPFGLTLSVVEPDGQFRADVIGSAVITLASNPAGATLNGGTSATFDGPNANFFGLTLDKSGAGVSFHIEMQGRAVDSFTTGTLDVLNPAPAGSIAWDGEGGDNLWTTALNWVGDAVPTSGDSVFIPGGAFVSFDAGSATVGTIVLGAGADLDLNGGTLTSTGNVYAGQTIGGPGYLELAGGASQISGTFSSVRVVGSVSVAGRTTITGDLIIDGATAEFNVGGQKVDVAQTIYTSNGGLLTMDGAADTLYTGSVSLAGGDEEGRLSAGVLIIQGGNFDQGFGDPKSFYANGTHITVFADGGTSTAVNLSDPESHFQNVMVQNPNEVDFDESGNGFLTIEGDLAVSAGGVAIGDTLKVAGTLSMDASSTVTVGVMLVGETPTLAGVYSAATTWFYGSPSTIPAAPQGYAGLYIDNTATLGETVSAVTVTVTGNGTLNVAGSFLLTDTLYTAGNGVLVMENAQDNVIVEDLAAFGGSLAPGNLTAGILELHGDFQSINGRFQASPGHVTRFSGLSGLVHQAQLSNNVVCEGPCFPIPNQFGDVEIINDTLFLQDAQGAGMAIAGNLTVAVGTLYAPGITRKVTVAGDLVADLNSYLTVNKLTLFGALTVDQYHYNVFWTVFAGAGQTIAALPYQTLTVTGSASLGEPVAADYVSLDGTGRLTMAGQWLRANNNFTANDQSHLVMTNGADSLDVGGTARFQSDSTLGDFTAGVIRTATFIQAVGGSGGIRSFEETGSHRVVPVSGSYIEMNSAGPAGSYLETIDFSTAQGPVQVHGVWITDSMILTDPGTSVAADTGLQFVVAGTYVQTDGTVNIPRLVVGGTLAYSAGGYTVDTTVFGGAGQYIPNNVPYANINVQYGAQLTGDLDLRSTGNSLLVENSGDLDINGFNLEATEFRTTGYGRLTMDDPADTLVALSAFFGGDSTNLSLTSGTIITQYLEQTVGYPATNKEYAPSGTHRLVLLDLGSAGDGVAVSLATPGLTDGSHLNVLVDSTYPMIMPSRLVVADSLLLDTGINGSPGNKIIDVYGPALFGVNAAVNLDSLIVHDTLGVDPLATYNVTATVFDTGAAPMPAITGYQDVVILGAQTLTAPITVGGDLYIKGNGVLTPNTQKVSGAGVLYVQDNAHLVMASVADTVEMGDANFDGATSGSDLAAGILRVRSGLVSGNTTTTQNFAPTGMMVEFYGGGTANIAFAVASPDNSFIDSLRVIEGTTISPQTYFLVMGPALFKDGSTLDGNSSSSALDFRGKVSVLDSSKVNDGGSSTLFFNDSLFVNTPGNYSVQSTYFSNTNGIPDLPYQNLTLGDEVHDTLSHPLTASGQLIITAGASGQQDLVLNGHQLTAGSLSLGGWARITMSNVKDSLVVDGSALFGGEALDTLLTAGVIRIGGDLTQNSFTSNRSFAPAGTRTEFFGTASHNVTFADPATSSSHFAAVDLIDGGFLLPQTIMVTTGTFTVHSGATFDASGLGPSDAVDFNGKTNVLAGGIFTNGGFSSVTFRDSLSVDPTASYSVVNTIFEQTDGIPDAPYTHLYLRKGVHVSLTHRLVVTGGLNIQAASDPNDTVRVHLNGNKVTAFGMYVDGQARITMDQPGDTLEIGTNATFEGLDQDTAMTAGVVRVGGYLQQVGTYSARSYAPAGTLTEFFGSSTHNAVFANPGTGQSHFGPLSVKNAGTLRPTTGFVVIGSTTIGSSAHFDGQSIPNGSTADFLGPVTVLSGGDFHSGASLAYFNFYGASALTVANGAAVPYDVINTGFSNTGNSLPDLPYQNLYLTDGVHDTLTFSPTITGVLSLSAVSPGAQDLVLNGQTLSVGAFITQDEGRLTMNNGIDLLIVAGNATFDGGSTTGRLTAGVLEVHGDFAANTGTSFNADSLFTVKFTGGGDHDLALSSPSTQHFGELRVTGNGTPDSDSLTLSFAGDLLTYRLAVTGAARVIGSAQQILTEQLAVDGATFQQVTVHESTTSSQPMQFDDVVFSGYGATDTQLWIEHPGSGILNPTQFFNVDFDNVADPGGHFLLATDTDGLVTFLNLQIYGPDSSLGASLTSLLSGALVAWFPPS